MALTRLQRRSRRRRRTPSRGFLPCATGRALAWCSGGFSWCTTAVARFWCSAVDLLCGSNKKRAITLGVLVAVTSFVNIVLYRVDERGRFYSSEKKTCACPRHEAHLENGAAQDSSVSLLKPTWCLRQGLVSLSGDEYRWQTGSPYGGGLSCACARSEPGTEDSSSWMEALPHLRPTQCLRTELLTLDEDTAHRDLVLSEGGRRVREADIWQDRPDNPKRFTGPPCVLGKEGFTSGRHYWELQLLREDEGWGVGVARESVNRGFSGFESPEEGVWAVDKGVDGQYRALTSPSSPLSPRQPPLKLGLYLDYEGGRLSVYDADTLEELFTFTGANFTGQICPYFWLEWGADMRLV